MTGVISWLKLVTGKLVRPIPYQSRPEAAA